MAKRHRTTKRGAFIVEASQGLSVEITDYKGDLPLNPVPWLRITTTERTRWADGREKVRTQTVMLTAAERDALIMHLKG